MFVPAGFALGWWLDLFQFRSRSRTEQLLWSVSLSSPLALVLTNVVGRYASPHALQFVFFLLDAVGLVLLLLRPGLWVQPHALDRSTKLVCLSLALAVGYIWLAALPLQWHGRLYEPVFSADWEIRLPLIRAAIRDGVPPHNPFFTFQGQSQPMRYYYYWYELCAQPGRLLHLSARSILVASSVYAMLVVIATLFLVLKYMLESTVPLRRRCLWMLGFCLVLGLDVLPSLVGLAVWRVRLQPEIEWWLGDRSPGLPSAVLFGPHHVAGIACGLLALLIVTRVGNDEAGASLSRTLRSGFAVGVCFTALVGTSSFVTLFFSIACALLFVDQLRRGDRRIPAALLLAAALSLLASMPYLHELTAKTVVAQRNGATQHALGLRLRGDLQTQQQLYLAFKRLRLPALAGPVRFLPRFSAVLLHYVCELGFFLFVLVLQVRRSFGQGQPTSVSTRALWMLTCTTVFFFLFVTSAPIQVVNDLGVHAGLVLRVLCIVWAAQIVPEYLQQRDLGPATHSRPWTFRVAAACLFLGLCMAGWQAVVDRVYLILLDHGTIRAARPFPDAAGLATYYNSMYAAQAAVARALPPDAVIQGNPTSRYGLVFRLYQERRQAAGDISCEGSFGGNPDLCQSYLPGILGLFGVHLPRPAARALLAPITPQAQSMAALDTVCSQDGLAAVVASRIDPVWYNKASWVWQGSVLYADPTVRVVRCPGAA